MLSTGSTSNAFFVWPQDLEQRGDSEGFEANAIEEVSRMGIILIFARM